MTPVDNILSTYCLEHNIDIRAYYICISLENNVNIHTYRMYAYDLKT